MLVGGMLSVLLFGVWLGRSAYELYVGLVGWRVFVVEVVELAAECCVAAELFVEVGCAGKWGTGGRGG